jgi:hypothetical protein
VAEQPNIAPALRSTNQKPLVGDWRAALSPEDCKIADELLSRYGVPVFRRLAAAFAAAPRKAGAPSKMHKRAPMLARMADLLVANPTRRWWNVATQVARENAKPMESEGTLRHWLLRAFAKDADLLMERAREKARLAHPVTVLSGRSPTIPSNYQQSMQDAQGFSWPLQTARPWDDRYLRVGAIRDVQELIRPSLIPRHVVDLNPRAEATQYAQELARPLLADQHWEVLHPRAGVMHELKRINRSL